jgi:hypothetical protein
MKSLSRNVVLTMFLAFAIGSICGCAEKPITFAEPGVQIWKINIIYENGIRFLDQTLILKPSETEKNVFHVTANVYQESKSSTEKFRSTSKWTGEIRNGAMVCNITGLYNVIEGSDPGSYTFVGEAKGTFSKKRAAGNIHIQTEGTGASTGKWTAERIS